MQDPIVCSQQLQADSTASNPAAPLADDALIASTQSLLDQVKTDLELTQGEVTMFIPDMPNVPPQNVPVLIAQANQAQAGDATAIRTLGVCAPAPSTRYSLDNVVEPIGQAEAYFRLFDPQQMPDGPATITILQQPKHGILRLITEADRGTLFSDTSGPIDPADPGYAYLPENGYLGKDKAVVLVEIGGIKVKVVYFFQAIKGGLGSYGEQTYCAKTGRYWKISTTLNPDGSNTLTSVEYQSPFASAADQTAADAATLASSLGLNFTADTNVPGNPTADSSGITLNLANLPNGAIGQTTASTITLDTTASGYGWFIDPTPADHSEYLPTSNPNEWVAKAGSDAYGKMDMLTVLLHEYGHALGINHSADPNDYMGTTLTAGVRRLPSAEEMVLMQGLVAQAKLMASTTDSTPTLTLPLQGGGNNAPAFPTLPLGTSFIGFLGLLRSSRYGGVSIAPDGSTLVTQYGWAAIEETVLCSSKDSTQSARLPADARQ
jgi:hypothetical protein